MNRKILYDGTYLRLGVEKATVDGKTIDFEFVESSPSVHVIPVFEDGSILLLSERKWFDWEQKLKVISGISEQTDEDLLSSAQREAQEEAGVTDGEWELFYTAQMKGTVRDQRVYYIVTHFSLDVNSPHEGEEIYGTQRVYLKDLLHDLLTGTWGTSPTPLVLLMLAYQKGVLKY